MTQIEQWLAIVAAVVFLVVPAMVSAGEETRIPPEMTWSPTPPASGPAAVPETRVVSTEQAQASDVPRPVIMKASPKPLALSAEDAAYQLVNRTVHDD